MSKKPKRPTMPAAFSEAERITWTLSSAEDVVRYLRERRDALVAEAVADLPEEECAAALEWTAWLTQTNCGFAEYQVGQIAREGLVARAWEAEDAVAAEPATPPSE